MGGAPTLDPHMPPRPTADVGWRVAHAAAEKPQWFSHSTATLLVKSLNAQGVCMAALDKQRVQHRWASAPVRLQPTLAGAWPGRSRARTGGLLLLANTQRWRASSRG